MAKEGVKKVPEEKKKRILRKITPSFRVYQAGVFIRNFRLTKSNLVVGSNPPADIILESKEVSPQHCSLKVAQGKGLYLVHLKGSLPTKINGVILSTEKKLSHGDQIEVGPYAISVSLRIREEQTDEAGVPRLELPKSLLQDIHSQPAVKTPPAKAPVEATEVEPQAEKTEFEAVSEQAKFDPGAEKTEFEAIGEQTEFEDSGVLESEEKTIVDVAVPELGEPGSELDDILAPLDREEKEPEVAEVSAPSVDESPSVEEPPSLEELPPIEDLDALESEAPIEDSVPDLSSPEPAPAAEVPATEVSFSRSQEEPFTSQALHDSLPPQEVAEELPPLPARQAPESAEADLPEEPPHDLLQPSEGAQPAPAAPVAEEAPAPQIEYILRFMNTEREGQEVKLVGEELIVGRRRADVKIPDSTVSKRHVLLEWVRGKAWRVRDLGSSNGTYINGKKISEGFIKDGDTLELGRVSLQFIEKRPVGLDSDAALDFEETQLLQKAPRGKAVEVAPAPPAMPEGDFPLAQEPSAPPLEDFREIQPVEAPSAEIAALLKRPKEKKFPWKRLAQLGGLLSIIILILALLYLTPLGSKFGLGQKGKVEGEKAETIVRKKRPPRSRKKSRAAPRTKFVSPSPAPTQAPPSTVENTPPKQTDEGLVITAKKPKKKSYGKRTSSRKKSPSKKKGSAAGSDEDEWLNLPVFGDELAETEETPPPQPKKKKRASKRKRKKKSYQKLPPPSKKLIAEKEKKKTRKKKKAKVKAVAKATPTPKPTPTQTPSAIVELDKVLTAGTSKQLLKTDVKKASRRLKNNDKKQKKVAKAISIAQINRGLDIDVSVPMLTEVKLGATKMSTKQFKDLLKTKIRPASSCYLQELKRDPRAAGKVVVSFTVKAAGRFSGASIVRSEIASPALHRCLKTKINQLHLGQALGDDAPVFYNFNFKGASRKVDFTRSG